MAHIHFIGIGGYSMSGIARVLRELGHTVTGSDAKISSRTQRLASLGIEVRLGHSASNVADADLVVFTTDIPADNPELAAARQRQIPVLHRSEMLARLLNKGRGVAVTGTHGKTTTATLTGHLFEASGLDPTILLGGELDAYGGSAKLGHGGWVVAEADESDGSFLQYAPEAAIITNIEAEHLEYYQGHFDNVVRAYAKFAENVREGGLLVLCGEDDFARHLASSVPRRTLLYGFSPECDLWAEEIEPLPQGGHAFTICEKEGSLGRFTLPVPGRHNVLNALGATAVARYAGIEVGPLQAAMATFQNAHRRFEVHYQHSGILVVDDYAHHPTEIRAVLRAARELKPRRLVAAFQPQRYTRTQNHFQGFVEAFDEADVVIITRIYSPPGEKPIPGVSGERLASEIRARKGSGEVIYAEGPEDAFEKMRGLLQEGDLLLTMGAGDIFRAAQSLALSLQAC